MTGEASLKSSRARPRKLGQRWMGEDCDPFFVGNRKAPLFISPSLRYSGANKSFSVEVRPKVAGTLSPTRAIVEYQYMCDVLGVAAS